MYSSRVPLPLLPNYFKEWFKQDLAKENHKEFVFLWSFYFFFQDRRAGAGFKKKPKTFEDDVPVGVQETPYSNG